MRKLSSGMRDAETKEETKSPPLQVIQNNSESDPAISARSKNLALRSDVMNKNIFRALRRELKE